MAKLDTFTLETRLWKQCFYFAIINDKSASAANTTLKCLGPLFRKEQNGARQSWVGYYE